MEAHRKKSALGGSSLTNQVLFKEAMTKHQPSFLPGGFKSELQQLKYDLQSAAQEVCDERDAVSRDLAHLKQIENEAPPHNLEIPKSLQEDGMVRKSGSTNLHQIPAYLEYCQLKDQEREKGKHDLSKLDIASMSSTELANHSNNELALVCDSSHTNLLAATDELREQKELIESRMGKADEDALPYLQEELDHVNRMIAEANAAC
eukprot:TRINITY_DN19801_c0_g1_i1.p1 TRINITY_DN19801_c0_g1~~TRINITY_DN19801_c0_g1_i1.p1  ORF type:complete len:205 (+),score=60.81 TRINITY_DN19801_c0_g1_i1:134-748(+)